MSRMTLKKPAEAPKASKKEDEAAKKKGAADKDPDKEKSDKAEKDKVEPMVVDDDDLSEEDKQLKEELELCVQRLKEDDQVRQEAHPTFWTVIPGQSLVSPSITFNYALLLSPSSTEPVPVRPVQPWAPDPRLHHLHDERAKAAQVHDTALRRRQGRARRSGG